MTPLMTIVLYMTALTWVTIIAASTIRAKGWTAHGLMYSLSNREKPLETNPLAHRADRTASNTIKTLFCFWVWRRWPWPAQPRPP